MVLASVLYLNPLTPTVAIKHPVLDRVKPSFVVFEIRALTLSRECQSVRVRMSKNTNGGLTRSAIGCLTAVLIWQQWASKG